MSLITIAGDLLLFALFLLGCYDFHWLYKHHRLGGKLRLLPQEPDTRGIVIPIGFPPVTAGIFIVQILKGAGLYHLRATQIVMLGTILSMVILYYVLKRNVRPL